MARSLLPPGFRFHPTDEELLVHYLKKKVSGKIDHDSIIGEIDIYKFEPSDLPGLAILCSRDPEWFFFNAQDKKYHGSRTNRTTRAGYWKATGKDRKVAVGSCTGMKKTLIYYVGRAPHGERTDWVMHEYRLDEELEMKMNSPKSFVLCRVRRKSGLGPRNGEQYGAPVLEEEEEEKEGKTLVNEVCGLPSLLPNSEVERTVQEMPSVATVIEGARMEGGENFESFLQEFLTFEEQEQNPAREVDFLVDGLLDLLDFQSNFTVAESTHATACTNAFDVNTSSLDDFSGLLHPTDSESIMLEDILQMVSGIEGPSEHPSGVQESPLDHSSLHMDDLQRVGYLELADMEVPCDGPSTLESADFERLLNELDSGVEFPPSTSFIQDQLQMQQSLPSDRESVRGLQHLGDTSMNNEFEVPLDSTQGLSVLDNIASRLSMADRVVPSGFALSSDHEGALANSSAPSSAMSDPHSNGAYGKPEAQLGEVDNHVESSYPLVDSAALVEYAAVNEQLVHSTPLSVALPNDCSNTPVHPAPAPSSPSSFARVISGFLSKVSVLPASAAELPSEMKRNQFSEKESSVYSAACSKAGESMLTNPGSLSISGSLLNCTIKLNPLQDEKQIAVTSELELQWAVSPIAIWDRHPLQHCKSSTNCISRYLFWITTVMLIVFCAFRGFCRSTRVAFT